MQDPLVGRITANPRYQKLVKTRLRLGWILTIIMLAAYYSYIGIIAFDKELFARRLGEGVMTVGIPVGFGVIVLAVVITGIYVWRANTKFDAMAREVLEEVRK
ncbi:DUF485 domain-containing protein [Alcaligenes sp. WGS1538]|uniref:DUF485 domain-containing protein n=1 Tax=Alcaligenes sp. WGS1538 TaxID=3366811 RepID=UPI00372D23DD